MHVSVRCVPCPPYQRDSEWTGWAHAGWWKAPCVQTTLSDQGVPYCWVLDKSAWLAGRVDTAMLLSQCGVAERRVLGWAGGAGGSQWTATSQAQTLGFNSEQRWVCRGH